MTLKYISVLHHISSTRIFAFVSSLLFSYYTFGQDDLIEKEDLSIRFISVSTSNDINIVTDFFAHKNIGLFLDSQEDYDVIKICNGDPFNVWLNSRLHFTNLLCLEMTKTDLLQITKSDSIYLALSTDGDFRSISAILFDNDFDRTIISNPIEPRVGPDLNSLFIIVFLVQVLLVGYLKYYLPATFDDLFKVSIFRKSTSTERTNEFDLTLVILSVILSSLSGFAFWYINDFSNPNYYGDLNMSLLGWLGYSAVILGALIFKYFLISAITRLNSFRNLAYTQVYDFLRFFTTLSLLLVAIFFGKYWLDIFGKSAGSWIWKHYYFIAYVVFLIYYYYKIGLNLRYKKLHIISYLCTTEILGAVIIALIFTK